MNKKKIFIVVVIIVIILILFIYLSFSSCSFFSFSLLDPGFASNVIRWLLGPGVLPVGRKLANISYRKVVWDRESPRRGM